MVPEAVQMEEQVVRTGVGARGERRLGRGRAPS
jgi:hypothetical protein